MIDYKIYTYGDCSNYVRGQAKEGSLHFENEDEVFKALETEEHKTVMVVHASLLEFINHDYISSLAEPFDLIHAGLQMGMINSFEDMQIASLSWFFVNPHQNALTVNWKADSRFFLINSQSCKTIGGIDFLYESWDTRVADLAYRLLRNGGKVFNAPQSVACANPFHAKEIPQLDRFRFVRKHINDSAALFYMVHELVTRSGGLQSIRNFRRSRGRHKIAEKTIAWDTNASDKRAIDKYSAIIPTIDRYAYLYKAVQSLLEQPFPPEDIVVYDQTPVERRDMVWNTTFPPDKVMVVFSDVPGQSTARNEAIKRTRHDWCLLFDDDSLALPDMVAQHIKVIQSTGFSVSTGSSLAPGQKLKDLPYDVNFLHLADVLDTGNCFIHKSIWRDVGGFDPAFDRGPGADNDFGIRIYLKGIPVVFNPDAVRIHYKATTGGLRTYGVWWRFKTRLRDPYPPPSQTYTIRKYYNKKFWPYLYFRFYLKASYRNNFGASLLLWLFLPFKLRRSIQAAKKLSLATSQ